MKKFLLAVLPAVGMLMGACSGTSNNLEDKVDYLPVKVSEKGSWGFVGPDGKMLYEDEFKNEPTMVINGHFAVENKDGSYALYKAEKKSPVEVKDCEKLVSVGVYEDGLCPVTKKKSRIEIVDGDGDVKFTLNPIDGNEVTGCATSFTDGLLLVSTAANKQGFVDKKGAVVIPPKYDFCYMFSDGVAFVANVKGEDVTWNVIDTKGEVLFKLKRGYRLCTPGFQDGYAFVIHKDDSRVCLIDKKGEITKLPKNVEWAGNLVGDNFIYRTEDNSYGVMSINDQEVLIRPKYEIIYRYGKKFVCNTSDYAAIIDADGDEDFRVEGYEQVVSMGRFGLLAKSRRATFMLDDKGKELKNCDFAQVSLRPSLCSSVESDYFDLKGTAKAIADLVTDKGVGKHKLGETPGETLSDPSQHMWTNSASDPDIAISVPKVKFDNMLYFGGYIACPDSVMDSDGYVFSQAPLMQISLYINSEKGWGAEGCQAIVKELKAKGFKEIKSTSDKAAHYLCVLSKGKLSILVGDSNDNDCTVMIVGSDYLTSEMIDGMIASADNSIGYPEEVEEEVAVVEDPDEYDGW